MQRERIARRVVLRERRIPGDELRRRDEVQRRGCQHGHMQRLADMASVFRPAGVLVEQASARGEIQQCGTRQHGHRAAQRIAGKDGSNDSHRPTMSA